MKYFIFRKRFGLMRVDFDSPNRTRTMKKSGRFFKKLIQANEHSSENDALSSVLDLTNMELF